MNAASIAELLRERFGGKILETKADSLLPFSVVAPEAILEVCVFLRNDDRLLMDHLELLAGTDYKDRIEVVYVTNSLRFGHRYTVKCKLPREGPRVSTVESVWGVANWHERETYDMLGVVFEGHSDLRRILCPDDWEGWPLRRDYKYPTRYRDMPV